MCDHCFNHLAPTPNDGSRPMERTLCLYNVPLTITEAQIQSAVSDVVRITMAVDENNEFKGSVNSMIIYLLKFCALMQNLYMSIIIFSYVYLHYKLAEDANLAFTAYKNDPVKIGETVIQITKLTPDDQKRDKKRNHTPNKKYRKGEYLLLYP